MKNELEELFKKWKENQLKQKENTNVFISDGYIDKVKYENSSKKILFILKESHYFFGNQFSKLKKFKEDSQVGFYKDFLTEFVYQFKKDKNDDYIEDKESEKIRMYETKDNILYPLAWYPNENAKKKFRRFDNRPKQKEKIARMAEYILNGNITSDYEKLKEALSQVAFMNINKMGGGDFTDPNKLFEYYELNKEYIYKEIDILNPDVIVLMVNNEKIEADLKKYWEQHNKTEKNQPKFIKRMLHTAARGKNLVLDKEEIEYFNENIGSEYKIQDINTLLNDTEKIDTIFNKDNNSIYLRFNKSTLQYLIKFIYRYEKS